MRFKAKQTTLTATFEFLPHDHVALKLNRVPADPAGIIACIQEVAENGYYRISNDGKSITFLPKYYYSARDTAERLSRRLSEPLKDAGVTLL